MAEKNIDDPLSELLLERKNDRNRLGALRYQADGLADNLSLIADRLRIEPELLVFNNEKTDFRFYSSHVVEPVEMAQILGTRNEIRSILLREQSRNQKLHV